MDFFLRYLSMCRNHRAFSLVEIVVALGVVSIALLTLVALASTGLATVKNSVEQTQSVNLISMIAADIKYSPVTNNVSSIYGLSPLPWSQNASGQTVSNITVGTSGTVYTYWASQGLQIFSAPSGTVPANAIYRITLRYCRAPGSAMTTATSLVPLNLSPAPIEALVIVSWPSALDPFAVGNNPRPAGRVESYLTFPRP